MVEGEKVCDIGCDHAFVPIYLIQSNRSKKVIAMDVKKGPVDIARNHVNEYGLSGYIEVRQSDGFEALGDNEADCAVIAGMGGQLMVDILKRGINHTKAGIRLVLQPQSEIEKVRQYLGDIGYCIVREEMLVEEDKFYTIIRAERSEDMKGNMSSEGILYGDYLLQHKNQILKSFLELQYTKNCSLIDSLSQKKTLRSDERINEIKSNNKNLLNIIKKYWG